MATVRILADRVSTGGKQLQRGDPLEGPEKNLEPLVDAGAAEWVEGGMSGGPEVDRSTWGWNVPEAKEHVEVEDDPVTLRAWLVGESRNPRYPPDGRKSVRDAIAERLAELKADLSRGPED